MAVPSTAADLSTTAASNSPAGSEAIGTSLDDYLRAIQAILKAENSKGTDIASASTIDVPSAGSYFVVTGTTGITTISDDWVGRLVILKFSGALTLTHSAGLILPGGANITTVAGDTMGIVNESTGVWRCVFYEPVTVTGTGATVKATSPTLVTPALGTPSSGVLTNCTGSPTLTAPVLGTATATSINKVAITAPATGSTLTIADGKTLTVSKTITLTGTDSTTYDLDSNATAGALAKQNASGTSLSFTGIPSGVRRVAITFNAVSLDTATDRITLSLGDSGGIENAGYTGSAIGTSSGVQTSPGSVFSITPNLANTAVLYGTLTLTKHDPSTHQWVLSGALLVDGTEIIVCSGTKSTSAALDRLQIDAVTGNFDAGTVGVHYSS